MDEQAHLATMEQEAYRASWSDGLVDVYLGLSLLWVGAMWTWPNELSGIAGIVPAIMVAPFLAARRRFMEARLGYVRWQMPRRRWERRNLWLLLGVGTGMFVLMIAAFGFLWSDVSVGSPSLAPGILAWLLALLTVGVAVLIAAARMLLYAAVLAVGGLVAVALGAEPGWPMLGCGLVATVVGGVMLRRFMQHYPVIGRT